MNNILKIEISARRNNGKEFSYYDTEYIGHKLQELAKELRLETVIRVTAKNTPEQLIPSERQ